jgi:hypothetical protein
LVGLRWCFGGEKRVFAGQLPEDGKPSAEGCEPFGDGSE